MPDLGFLFSDYASFHQATLDINSIIDHYEEELVKVSKRDAATEREIENLQSTGLLVKETADRGLARRERIQQLEKFGEEAKKNLAKTEQRLKIALADHDLAKDEIEHLKAELIKVKSVAKN